MEKELDGRVDPTYERTTTTLGTSRRALDVVQPWEVKATPQTKVDEFIPPYTIEVVGRPQLMDNKEAEFSRWLRGYGDRIGKRLIFPGSQYYMILTYIKQQAGTLMKQRKLIHLNADTLREIEYKAARGLLIQEYYKDPALGRLKKLQIRWLDS